MKSLRQTFVDRRLALRMTQAALARAAGLTQKTVSDFETAKTSITLANLERLLAVLGLELMTREASPRPTLDELAQRYPDEDERSAPARARPRKVG
jgi:transcriptional regulator with XRE-family HTH domain